jgi:putative DNA primase/helicase
VRSGLWERFLEDSTEGDRELQDFLARAVGYSLTGLAREQVLFFVHGPTASGKSTFIDTIRAIAGDYAATSNFETFLRQKFSAAGNTPRPDLARLAGKRFVASVEVAEGKSLAEEIVKQITGGDKITVRHLYKEEFEFDPNFKLWLVANHSPRVDASDDAMWRRILRVPFEHTVPREKRDPTLRERLRDFEGPAAAAVLAWAVRGCLDWQAHGLGVPSVVVRSTEEYREGQDVMGGFAEACLVVDTSVGSTLRIKASDLLQMYNDWAVSRGERRENMRSLMDKIPPEWRKEKRAGNFWYYGVAMKGAVPGGDDQ